MYQEMQKPRNVSAVNVALRASRDFRLIDFVKAKPTKMAITQPIKNPTIFATTGATASVIDDEAIVRDAGLTWIFLTAGLAGAGAPRHQPN
jgi:hypothetical protein